MLPSFVGAVDVPAGGDATTVGVPVQLKDSGTNQDACKNVTYDFVYSGTSVSACAVELRGRRPRSRPAEPVRARRHVALTATVTPVADVGPVTGTVRFYVRHPHRRAAPARRRVAGGLTGRPRSTSDLPVGDAVVFAAYDGSRTFGASTSAGVAQAVVGPPAICRGPFSRRRPRRRRSLVDRHARQRLPLLRRRAPSGHRPRRQRLHLDGQRHEVIARATATTSIISGDGNKDVDGGAGNNRIVLGRGTSRVVAGKAPTAVSLGSARAASSPRQRHERRSPSCRTRNTVVLGNGRNTVRITGRGGYNTVRTGAAASPWSGSARARTTRSSALGKGNICHVPRPPRHLARHARGVLQGPLRQLPGGDAMSTRGGPRFVLLRRCRDRGAVAVGLGSGAAYAFWSSGGTGTGSASAGRPLPSRS